MASIEFFDKIVFCSSGGMVYTEDSKSSVARHVGSNPTSSRDDFFDLEIYFL